MIELKFFRKWAHFFFTVWPPSQRKLSFSNFWPGLKILGSSDWDFCSCKRNQIIRRIRFRYLVCHATFLGGGTCDWCQGALRDDPSNGCVGDYPSSRKYLFFTLFYIPIHRSYIRRVMFGSSGLYVLHHPAELKQKKEEGTHLEEITYDLAQAEIAANSGFDMGKGSGQTKSTLYRRCLRGHCHGRIGVTLKTTT